MSKWITPDYSSTIVRVCIIQDEVEDDDCHEVVEER